MDEKQLQYIKDVYRGLGGESRFGSYDSYYNKITTDDSYIKEIHTAFGESVLGPFDTFSNLVKKKEESTGPVAPMDQPSVSDSSVAPSDSSGEYRGFMDPEFEERNWFDALKHYAGVIGGYTTDYILYEAKAGIRKDQRYIYGDTQPLVDQIVAEATQSVNEIAGQVLPNFRENEDYQQMMDNFQAEVDEKYTGAEQQTIYKDIIERDRQNLENQYLNQKFADQGVNYKEKYLDMIPENLKEDEDFMEVLNDKIYFESRLNLDLNGKGRYNDQPALEHMIKNMNAGAYEIVTGFGYAGNYIYANAISDLEGEEKAQYLKDKRSEYIEQQNRFNESMISFEQGITASAAAGDWGNAGLQFAGQLARTAPQIALTIASSGAAGALGKVAGTVGGMLSNGVYGGVNTYVNIIDSPEWEGNESGAFGYALSSGIGEGIFAAVSSGIMNSAAKGVQATGKVSKSFKDVAGGFLRRRGIPFLQEGVEEFATEVALGYAEAGFKGEMADTGKIFENALDSFLVGGTIGVGFSYIGSAQAATQSRFDAAIGKKAAILEGNLIDLNEALKKESDPEKRTNIENTIADTELELEKLKQSRIPFYDMMSVRHADDFKTIQQLDLDISRSVARMKKLPEGKSREVMKQRLEALIEQRNSIEKKHAGESLELTADEKSMMFDGRVQEGIDNLVEERSDAQDSRDAVEQSGTFSAIEAADKRLGDVDSKLNEARRLASELEVARKNLEDKQKSKDDEGFDDSAERQAVKDAERSLAQALKIKAPDADTDVKTDVTEEAPADPEPSKPLDQQIDDKVSKADADRAPKKRKRKGAKMRGFLGRTQYNFDDETRRKIVENPNSYFDPQSIKEMTTEFSQMTDAELVEAMSEDGLARVSDMQTDKAGNESAVSILALIERVRRAHERGDSQAVADLMEQGGFLTTNAARILRYAQELKKANPDFLVNTLRTQIEKSGAKITPEQDAKLKRLVSNWEKSQKLYIEARDNAISLGTKKAESDLRRQDLRFKKDKNALDVFMNGMIPQSWGSIFTTTVQGNLLVAKSHVVNAVSNILRSLSTPIIGSLGYVINEGLLGTNKAAGKVIAKGKKSDNRSIRKFAERFGDDLGVSEKNPRAYSLGAYFDAWRYGIPRAFRDIARDIRGLELDSTAEWRLSAGLSPVRAMMNLFSKAGSTKRGDVPVYDSLIKNVNTRLKNFFQGTFGVVAATNFKLLTMSDLTTRYLTETRVLSQIGRARGLKGQELKQFIKFPTRQDYEGSKARIDKEAVEDAKRAGAEQVFQNQTTIGKGVKQVIGGITKMMELFIEATPLNKIMDGDKFARSIVRGLNMPYVDTPAAIMTEALTYSLPGFAVARAWKAATIEGDSRRASEHLAKGIVGAITIQSALILLKEGLFVGEEEDWREDEAERNLRRETFQKNSINITGIKRLLAGEDPSYREGDYTPQVYRLGVIGAIMQATAMSTNREKLYDQQEDPLLSKGMAMATGLGTSTAASMMDQTFMQGTAYLLKALATDDEKQQGSNVARWFSSMFKAGSSAVLPNQLASLTKYDAEFLPDRSVNRDLPWLDQAMQLFEYTIRERTFNLEGSIPKISIKGSEIPPIPAQVENPVSYYFFDPTNARTGSGDPYDIELYRLFEETGVAHDVLKYPKITQNVRQLIPSYPRSNKLKQGIMNSGKQYTFFKDFKTEDRKSVLLTQEQREQITRTLNKNRYEEVLSLFDSSEYMSASDDAKLDMLTDLNEKYTAKIDVDQNGFLLPHSVIFLDAMQELYEKSKQEDE